MNKPSINIRKYLARAASSALVMLAAVLAISALTAQSPSPTPCKKRGESKDWPTNDEQPKFEAAFDKALIDSKTNKGLRCKLLKSPASAKTAVEKILDGLYPGQKKVRFPEKVEIRFYEPEEPVSLTMNLTSAPNYPNDHCLAVFYLPEEGTAAAKEPSFRDNLMCCYKPWNPTKTSPATN
jgi:hypothetical protein